MEHTVESFAYAKTFHEKGLKKNGTTALLSVFMKQKMDTSKNKRKTDSYQIKSMRKRV